MEIRKEKTEFLCYPHARNINTNLIDFVFSKSLYIKIRSFSCIVIVMLICYVCPKATERHIIIMYDMSIDDCLLIIVRFVVGDRKKLYFIGA